jgi:hypothetical protein
VQNHKTLKIFNINKLLLAVFLLCIIAGGCKKYEDGPAISFTSKANRLFGYWQMEKWILNNVEQTAQYQFQHKFGFAKDGTYYYSFFDVGSGYTINFTGTWQFRQQKNQLVLGLADPRNGMEYQVWEINRLTSEELWLETLSPGNFVEWQLKAE